MSRRVNTPGGRKRRRRGLTRVFISVAFVAALLYWEQAALLYLLSTLAVCGLLLVVAFSDLERRDEESRESTRHEEAARAAAGEVTAGPVPRPELRVARPKRRDAA